MAKFMRAIDWWSEYSGRYISYIAIILTVFMFLNVMWRYILTDPFYFEADLSLLFYSFHFLLGGAWVLLHRSNVRVDIICGRWPDRGRAILELVFYIAFFFPWITIVAWFATQSAISAYVLGEKSHLTPWMPSMVPMRVMIAAAFWMLLLQGIVKFIRHIGYVRKGVMPTGGIAEGEIPS